MKNARGWGRMNKKQRSDEMIRRRAVALARKNPPPTSNLNQESSDPQEYSRKKHIEDLQKECDRLQRRSSRVIETAMECIDTIFRRLS